MNDATHAVGAAPWAAPGADDGARPSAVDSAARTPEIEHGGRLWEFPDAREDASPADHEGEDQDVPVLAELDAGLARFAEVDWAAWQASDPAAAAEAWATWQTLAAMRDEAGFAGEPRETDAEQAERLAAAQAELARDIEGWSPELAAEIARFGRAKGFTAEELAGVEDPREVKVLHLAMLGEQAQAARAFGRFRPPVQLGGQGFTGAQPQDRQSTAAWMQARHAQLRKKARG